MGTRTHTCATLEVSRAAYDEIYWRLSEAGYGHAFRATPEGPAICLDGLEIRPVSAAGDDREE